MDRRAFLALLTAAGCARLSAPGMGARPRDDLEEASIAELSARMARGSLGARALVDRYLARIDALDRSGPTLRAVIEINPDARDIAAALDDERKARGPRGPLHGIPLLIKDNIDTGDRMQTTAGSLALAGPPARRDARVVARLREAGAVILGKTNLSEWANIRSTHSTSGWSARGGLTRNPYALDRNTSGSSSGSATAVAASLAAAAVGTETDGSIVSPSSICGIVGMKPTVGLVSRAGIVPISHSQDTAGPMGRSVADAAVLLSAMAEGERRDYARGLDAAGANGARIGVVRDVDGIGSAVWGCFDAALADLRRLGAVLVDVAMPHARELQEPELEVLLTELKADMPAYLATRPDHPARTLEDLVRFDASHADAELRWFGQELFEKALSKGGLESAAYVDALAKCRRFARAEGIDAAIGSGHLDALVAPTGGPAWVSDLVNGDAVSGSSSSLAAVAGYPSISVPCGEVFGLPLGVCFFAGANAEATLLRIAYAYEQATHHRRTPRYLATIG